MAAAALANDGVNANAATGNGGGVFNASGQIALIHVQGTMTLDPNASVSRNHAAAGGGIDMAGGTVTLNGAAVAGNIPGNCQPAGRQERGWRWLDLLVLVRSGVPLQHVGPDPAALGNPDALLLRPRAHGSPVHRQ